MSTDQRPAPEQCPQPFWHRTHRYCPCCTWTEQPEPPAPPSADAGTLIEQLADAEHASWARWMAYLFSVCRSHDNGDMTIPASFVAHWQRQVAAPYAELTEREKESDREEVRCILPLIEAAAQRQHAAEVEDVQYENRELERQVVEFQRACAECGAALAERDAELADVREQLALADADVATATRLIEQRDAEIRRLREELRQTYSRIMDLSHYGPELRHAEDRWKALAAASPAAPPADADALPADEQLPWQGRRPWEDEPPAGERADG